jgi:hypothetical protein
MPLSVDMPAPVRATTLLEEATIFARRCTSLAKPKLYGTYPPKVEIAIYPFSSTLKRTM